MIYTPNQPIRALSWKEPFASLMLRGKIETRTWSTKYRGWVLICASKAPYRQQQLDSIASPLQQIRMWHALKVTEASNIEIFPGKAIAIGWLGACRKMDPSEEDRCFVDWHPGLYCHIYVHVHPIVHFDWKGSLGWKTLGEEDRAKIKLL